MRNSSILSIKKIILIAVIATVFAFVLVGQQAQGSETNEAKLNEQANATTHQISFTTQGIDSGVDIKYELTDKSVTITDYKLGDMLEVEDGATVEYAIGKDKNREVIRITDSVHYYSFYLDNPLGYDFDSCSTQTPSITTDTNFVLVYKINTTPYTLKATVSDAFEKEIAGATVKLYYPKTQTFISGTTLPDGSYTFSGLLASQAEGVLIAIKEGFANNFTIIDSLSYDQSHSSTEELKLQSIDKANILLNNTSSHHKAFEFYIAYLYEGEVEFEAQLQNESFFYNAELIMPSEWKVDEKGNLINVTFGETSQLINIKPIAEEGYSIAKWKLNRGNNAEEYYGPNETFTLQQGEKLNVEPIYEAAPTPGPQPIPTPGEDVKPTAQTGDNTAVIPFAILAVVSCAAVVFSRKRSLNK